MKKNNDSIFWGVLLILAAAAVLAQRLGYINYSEISNTVWTWVFAGIAVIFFLLYLFSKLQNWGFLFPTCIFGALAVVIPLGEGGTNGELLGSIILGSIAIPFIVAFFTHMKENWWALIPAFALGVLAFIVNFADTIRGEWIGALVMFAIGLPFILVYFVNRTQRWALIPGLIMIGIGIVTLASMASQWVGVLVPFIIAAPFFYVYFAKPAHWWALIPAGIMASIGLSSLLQQPFMGALADSDIPAIVQFLGWAATFFFLWLKRTSHPTDWAKIPALIFGIVAVVQLVVGAFNDELGLIILLFVGGLVLLYFGLRPKKA